MRPTPLLLTGALAVGGVAAAVLMMPDAPERIAMLSRDGRYEAAMEFGKQVQVEGTSDPLVLADLFGLDSHVGDPVRARQVITAYLEKRPGDVVMLRHGVAFFRDQQDFESYLRWLERLVELDPTLEDVERLAALYRTRNRFDDEKRILLAHRDERLSAASVERLARLLTNEGRFADAADLLERSLQRNQNLASVQPLLFETLMRSDQAARAAGLANEWAVRGLDPSEQAVMVLALAQAGETESAGRLAANFPRSSRYDPAPLVWALGAQRRFDLLKLTLRRWMEGADRATQERIATIYVDSAAGAGALGEMVADLHQALADPSSPQAASALVILSSAFRRWGYQGLAPLRHLLTPDLLARNPLFAAQLAIAEQNPLAARYFLLETDLSQADDDDASEWHSVAETALAPGEVAADLMARWRAGRLSVSVYPYLQKSAAAAGLADPTFDLLRGPAAQPAGEAGL